MERNFTRLDTHRQLTLVPTLRRIVDQLDEMYGIQTKYLDPYQELDREIRGRLDVYYELHICADTRRRNRRELIFSIVGAFAKGLAITLIVVIVVAKAPLFVLGAAVVLVAGAVVMAQVPENYVPEWLQGAKRASDSLVALARETIEHGPVVLVDAIHDGFVNMVQTPQGVATLVGMSVGMLTGKGLVVKLKKPALTAGLNTGTVKIKAGTFSVKKISAKATNFKKKLANIKKTSKIDSSLKLANKTVGNVTKKIKPAKKIQNPEKILASRTKGLDLRPHPSKIKQISAKRMKELNRKLKNRTITKSEYKQLMWNKNMNKIRKKAVRKFWDEEIIRIKQGKPTRPWTMEQVKQIQAGKKPTVNGEVFQGHHSYSVSQFPHLAGRHEVIWPTLRTEHFKMWHGGNWTTSLPGKPMIPIF
jgi:hypothetical protein